MYIYIRIYAHTHTYYTCIPTGSEGEGQPMTCSTWAEAVWSLAVLGRHAGLCTLLQAFDRSLGHDTQVALAEMDARHLLWVAWGQGALVSVREEQESGNAEALDDTIMQGIHTAWYLPTYVCVYICIYVCIYIYILLGAVSSRLCCVCMCVCVRARICASMYVCLCIGGID